MQSAAGGLAAGLRVGALALLAALPACRRQPAISDRNGDGRVQLLCLGDSNTDNNGRADHPKWCELLAAKHPEWRVVNGAARFSRAAGDCLLCGEKMLSAGIGSASPDVVLISLGTNDIVSFRDPPEMAVNALLALRDQATAANIDVFVATVPPIFKDFKESAHVGEQIDAANAMLARRIPATRLIDFHSNMRKEDFDPDGVHVNRSGQEKRAAAADRALTNR